MHSERIKGLYQQLISLLKDYRTSSLSQQQIQATLQFSNELILALKEYPDPLLSELSTFRPQLPFVTNLVFRTSLLAALIGARNKINDSCSQQIICSAITLYCFNQVSIEKWISKQQKPEKTYIAPANLTTALDKAQLNVWSSAFAHFSSLGWRLMASGYKQPNARKPLAVLYLAHSAAMMLVPKGDKKPLSFPLALKFLYQMVSSKQGELLHPLTIYPGPIPPGCVVSDRENQLYIVLSLLKDGLMIRPANPSGNDFHELRKISLSAVNRFHPTAPRKSFSLADSYWDVNWESMADGKKTYLSPFVDTYKLDKPPGVLIDVQTHLQKADIDFNQLADLIAGEPSLAQHLKESASHSSRSKLPIQNIKHSLMMHGYERANSLLIQQALLLRLNQNYFPLQDSFIQFTRLRCHLAASIIGINDKSLVEEANCLACFACSGLFTVATLKGVQDWQTESKKPFDIRYLIATHQQQSLHDNAIKLAEAWHQKPHMIMALRNHLLLPEHMAKHKVAIKLAITLGLSLLLARKIYFAEQSQCPEAITYQQQGLKKLGLNKHHLEEICQQANGFCHSHCAISD